jgi:hypothetical protein
MKPEMLSRAITLAQTPVPVQVCYIVPLDAPPDMLSAIFAECYARWGGRETLIMPIADGKIDEAYWAWAHDLDPDVVYTYVDLDPDTLSRVDHELMPAVYTVHKSGDRFTARHDVETLQTLSVLPMVASAERLGPQRRLRLVSAHLGWSADRFVTDSFGLNPHGPGWAQDPIVRKYVDTLVIGERPPRYYAAEADEEVGETNSLLEAMHRESDTTLTMAQLSGAGFGDVFFERSSRWTHGFNIVVGDTALDRIAFWNGRLGVDDYQRRNLIALRVPEAALEDAAFLSALVLFIARWSELSQGNSPFATIRSSSVPDERLRPLADALPHRNVHTSIERFSGPVECTPASVDQRGLIRPGSDRRFIESVVPLTPERPAHLTRFGPMSSWLGSGGWTVHVQIKREDTGVIASSPSRFPLPRRWQAVRQICGAAVAKTTVHGNLRLFARGDEKPQPLTFTDDDASFIVRLFLSHQYLWRTDVRAAKIPKLPITHPRISSAGRHLAGFLRRLGDLHTAFEVLGSQFCKFVFEDMAMPRAIVDDEKRRRLALLLKKRIENARLEKLETVEDFELLANVVSRIAPDLKTPRGMRAYDWFVEMYRRTDESKRHASERLSEDEIEQELQKAVAFQLRLLCADGVLTQGYAWRCPFCLHNNWATVEALKRLLACEVCGRGHRIPPNLTWSFVLDGYIAKGLRERGLRGLIWALGTLRWQARWSFMFAPPLDLEIDGELRTDSDINCLVDGKFVIGEVKESDRSITDALGDKLIEVGRGVRPNVLVVACLDRTALPKVTKQAQRIQAALRDVEVWPLVPSAPEQSGFYV